MSSKSNFFLISIHPQYSDQIFAGNKTLELRKKVPKLSQPTYFLIYSTKPQAQIKGGFLSSGITSATPQKLWSEAGSKMGVSEKKYMEYFEGRDMAHAIVIERTFKLNRPISLEEMRVAKLCPPQSYLRLNDSFFDLFPDAVR